MNEDFLKEQNSKVEEVSERVLKVAANFLEKAYISDIEKSCVGLVEVIYARKIFVSGEKVQKVCVIPLDRTVEPLIRNCYYSNYGCSRGFHVYGWNEKGSSYFDYMPFFEQADNQFPFEKIYRTNSFYAVDIANLDSKYKYCGFENIGIGVVDYLRLYDKYNVAESMMKLKLARFINEKALKYLQENKPFLKYVHKYKDEINKNNLAFHTVKNAYKKNPNCSPNVYSDSLRYRVECGKELNGVRKDVYSKLLKIVTQERLCKYLAEKNISSVLYGDYIVACDELGLDLTDTKVIFPKDFEVWHDEYCKRYATIKAEKDKDKFEKINKQLEKVAKKFCFLEQNGDLKVFVAKSKQELLYEGEMLNHCVGRMSYDKKMIDGESVICFIRKEEGTPYITCELKVKDNGLEIVQMYGKNNSIIEDEEIVMFKQKWIKEINKEYKKRKIT